MIKLAELVKGQYFYESSLGYAKYIAMSDPTWETRDNELYVVVEVSPIEGGETMKFSEHEDHQGILRLFTTDEIYDPSEL
jgi:hypothetical protein